MASLWKRKNSKYFTACWTDSNGRRMKRSTKTADQLVAQKLAQQWQAEGYGRRKPHPESELRARQQQARVLRNLRSHYRKTYPNHYKFLVRSALGILIRARQDCVMLDNFMKEKGRKPRYLKFFTTYDTDGALHWIHRGVIAERRAFDERKTPIFKAMRGPIPHLAEEKWLLEQIREMIRDGLNEKEALEICANHIKEVASRGGSKFFEDLGDFLRRHRLKPIDRNWVAWIIRNGLPLCLWECGADGKEAFERMKDAAYLRNVEFAGADENYFFLKRFLPAWRNVRNKKLKI